MNAPYQKHSQTSKLAAEEIKPEAATLREQVYQALKDIGPMTDEEMQDLLDMNPSTQRPRRIELQRAGWVEGTGSKRLTKSQRQAVVWRAVP